MKRTFCVILILTLLLGMTACHGERLHDSVTFYYLRDSGQSSEAPAETFYAAEKRQYHNGTQDLRYYLETYLRGPLGDGMISPFPENTRLVDLQILDDRVTIRLSEEFTQLGGIRLSTACACLSLTVFDLTDAGYVTVISPATDKMPAVEITMSRANLILNDTVTGNNHPR